MPDPIVYRTASGSYVDPHGKPAKAPAKQAAPQADALPSLSGLKTAELEQVAADEGVDLSDAANNDERRALIEKARGG